MKKYIFTLLVVFAASVASLAAQDRIYKIQTQDPVECKITEVGEDEVRYTLPDYDPSVTFSIDRNKLRMVVFESGQVMEFASSFRDPANYEGQRRNMLKVNFLSPLYGPVQFYYERSVKPGQSFEVGVGIVTGAVRSGARGFLLSGGYKFMLSPAYYTRGMRYAHLLKGGYLKPELEFTSESYSNNQSYYAPSRTNSTHLSVTLVLGKQWVFNNLLAVDIYAGLGYGFMLEGHAPLSAPMMTSNPGAFLTGKAGVKLGILFGK